MKFETFRLFGCLAVTCFASLVSIGLSAQTVDIVDFLVLDTGNSWDMEGKASLVYSGTSINPDVDISITTSEGPILHSTQTREMKLEASGSAVVFIFSVSFSVVQTLDLSLDSNGLYLHSREGALYINGTIEDLDEETYITPALLLPRLITVGNSYFFTADLSDGEVEDTVLVESIEIIDTSLGAVEAIKLILFSEDKTPVVLWLGRNVGCVKAQIDTTLNSDPLGVFAVLTNTSLPWDTESVDALWAATINEGEGWHSVGNLGSFWVPYADSPWMGHPGFGWAYCDGDLTSLWIYLPGAGWFWTSSDIYPFMYSETLGEMLYYSNTPDSYLFWSFVENDWLDLGPAG